MTSDVLNQAGRPVPSRGGGLVRLASVVLGIAAFAVGVLLLANPATAARSLAVLVCLALVVGGLLEIANARETAHRWPGLLLGAVLVVGGVLAVAWPSATLWSLAVITGVSLVVHGLGRIAVAVADRATEPGWGWSAVAGVLNVVVGILALVWPAATVRILSLLLGVQVIVFGFVLAVTALVRRPQRPVSPQA